MWNLNSWRLQTAQTVVTHCPVLAQVQEVLENQLYEPKMLHQGDQILFRSSWILSPFAKHGLVGDLHTFGNHQWGLVLGGWDFSAASCCHHPTIHSCCRIVSTRLTVKTIFVRDGKFFVDNCHCYYGYYNNSHILLLALLLRDARWLPPRNSPRFA